MRQGVTGAAALLLLLVVPAVVEAQDRAAELEARRAARAQQLARGDGDRLWGPLMNRYPWAAPVLRNDCFSRPYGAPTCAHPPTPFSGTGYGIGYGGYPTGLDPWSAELGGYGYGGGFLPGHGYGSGLIPGYGYGSGRIPGYGYPVPNPYADWSRLWGRGWLDGAEVPPYHRYQYRFFPETLPDPTREGYIEPRLQPGALPDVVVPPVAARRRCARIELVAPDGAREVVLLGLPALGVETPEALRSVLRDRLERRTGVTVRDLDGYVFRFPGPERIEELRVTGC